MTAEELDPYLAEFVSRELDGQERRAGPPQVGGPSVAEMHAAERTPKLSIVLSTLGNYEVLKRVLDGYDRQDAPAGSFELVVVVDRADTRPEAVEAAIGDRPYAVRRVTGRVRGLSGNRNTGWREARAPIVLLTDNDTVPIPRLVSEHLEWHRRYPENEAAIAGHVRWARELRPTPFMKWLDHGMQFNFPAVEGIDANYALLYGANSSVKRSFIERVGDWDEVNLPYLDDDLDWSYRASKHGLRVLYNRDAIVDHVRYDATLDSWREKMRRLAFTERQFTALHPELEPWFFNMFTWAASKPAAKGRGRHVAWIVSRDFPWLGKRAWDSADLYWKQQLAPRFLEAWNEFAEHGDGVQADPDYAAP